MKRINVLRWTGAIVMMLLAVPGFASELPPPGEPRPVHFAEPDTKTLSNGLRVFVVSRPGLPLLAAQFAVRSGAEVDPPDMAGLASMTAGLLTRGTSSRPAPEIASSIEALGGAIESNVAWDASALSLTVLSGEAEAALAIFADVIRHPVFADAEIERVRRETLDSLRIAFEEPRTVALTAMQRVIFGKAPYGHARGGTLESIGRITRASIVSLHAQEYRPDNAILVFAGNLTAEQGFAWAEKLFGDWKNPETPPLAHSFPKPDFTPRTVFIDMPDAGQAAVVVGCPGIKRDADDRMAGLVANGMLGNGYTSRLNSEIRIKRGLSYGARSVLQTLEHPGPFLAYAQTKNSAALEVAGLIRTSLTDMAREPASKDELAPRVSSLVGDFSRGLETNEGYASAVAELATYDRPQGELNTFIPSAEKVTAAEARAFIERRLPADQTALVIAGKFEDYRAAFEKSGIKAEIIPQADLNFDSVNLRKAQ